MVAVAASPAARPLCPLPLHPLLVARPAVGLLLVVIAMLPSRCRPPGPFAVTRLAYLGHQHRERAAATHRSGERSARTIAVRRAGRRRAWRTSSPRQRRGLGCRRFVYPGRISSWP